MTATLSGVFNVQCVDLKDTREPELFAGAPKMAAMLYVKYKPDVLERNSLKTQDFYALK